MSKLHPVGVYFVVIQSSCRYLRAIKRQDKLQTMNWNRDREGSRGQLAVLYGIFWDSLTRTTDLPSQDSLHPTRTLSSPVQISHITAMVTCLISDGDFEGYNVVWDKR
jgi:hypothetical protein